MKANSITIPVTVQATVTVPNYNINLRQVALKVLLRMRRRMMRELGVKLSFSETIATANFISALSVVMILVSGGGLIPIACGMCYLAVSYIYVNPVTKRLNKSRDEK